MFLNVDLSAPESGPLLFPNVTPIILLTASRYEISTKSLENDALCHAAGDVGRSSTIPEASACPINSYSLGTVKDEKSYGLFSLPTHQTL